MKQITIKEVGLDELETLQAIGRQTFLETFASSSEDSDLSAYLETSFALEKLSEELQNKDSQFYFAWWDQQLIAYLKWNTAAAQTEPQESCAMEIERIYVLREFQSKKVGQWLLNKAILDAQDRKAPYIWLGVWENNFKALAFYEKNGFKVFGQHLFKLGEEEALDLLMRKELSGQKLTMDLQPHLESPDLVLYPLIQSDFDEVYQVACDPRIWEQHPNKNRWQRAEFENFFRGAMASQGAFKIVDRASGAILGSTRFYDYDQEAGHVLIGYTFYAVSQWGKGINLSVKRLMLDYAFQFVSQVYFHIGAKNIRSQIAIERLGAEKIAEESLAYFGEESQLNFVYCMDRDRWNQLEKTRETN